MLDKNSIASDSDNKATAPLAGSDAYLVIEAGNDKPSLLLDTAEDIWHTVPQAFPTDFEQPFTIIDYDKFAP